MTAVTDDLRAMARTLMQALSPLQSGGEDVAVTIQGRPVRVPAAIVPVLFKAAKLLSEGHAVDVVSADEEVSAQEAADFLMVSRPYLLNLVKKGVLPCRMVGVHHRIPMSALLVYKRDQTPRRRSLDGLTAETEDLGH